MLAVVIAPCADASFEVPARKPMRELLFDAQAVDVGLVLEPVHV